MVKPGKNPTLLYLPDKPGGMVVCRPGRGETLVVGGDEVGVGTPAGGRVLRVVPCPGEEPRQVAGRIEAALRHRRKRPSLALHPSLWRGAPWGPEGLRRELHRQGYARVALVLDEGWTRELPGELLGLLAEGPSGERALLEDLPLPACLVGREEGILAAGAAWGRLAAAMAPGELETLLGRARREVSHGGGAREGILLAAGDRWFEFWRGPFQGGWNPALWLVVERTDTVGRMEEEQESRRWLDELLRSLDSWIADPSSLARVFCRALSERTGAEWALLFHRRSEEGELKLLGGTGPAASAWTGGRFSVERDTPVAWVGRTGKSLVLESHTEVTGISPEILLRAGLRWSCCLPLLAQGRVLGVVMVGSRRGPVPPELLARGELEAACHHAGVLLYAGNLYRRSRGAATEWERVFQAVDQPVLVLGPELEVIRANRAAARAAGKEAPALLEGLDGARVLAADEEERISVLLRRVMRSGRSALRYNALPLFGGRYHLDLHPLPGTGGAPAGIVVLAANISRERELEGLFRGVIDNANALFFVTDPWGRITFAAGVLDSLLGRTVGELLGTDFSTLVHASDRSKVVKALARLGVQPGEVKDTLYRALGRGDEVRWHHLNGFSEADRGKQAERIYLFITDVTELVEAREASEFKKEKLRGQRDMMTYFLAAGSRLHREGDLKGKLELVCSALAEAGLFNRSLVGLFGGDRGRFRVVASRGVGRRELSLVQEAQACLGTGNEQEELHRFRISDSWFLPAEARLPGEMGAPPGGEWVPSDRWREGDLLIVPLRNRQERMVGVLAVDDPPDGCRPGESKVRAMELLVAMAAAAVEHSLLEADVDRREREWESIFEQVDELVAIVDGEGILRRVNTALAEFLGCTREELVGREAPPPLSRGDKVGSNPMMDTIMTGCATNFALTWKDRGLRVSVRPWIGSEGEGGSRGAIWVARLDDDRRRQRSRLETVGSMTRDLVHDFNNILCAIEGQASLMLLDQDQGKGASQPLRQIEQACMAASRVVSRLLDLSRGRARGEQEIDLSRLVREAMDFLRHTVPTSIAFDLDLPRKSIIVKAEPGILDEVLSNLVINARDALPQRGTIRVALRCREAEGRVVLAVEDDGPGIPPHLLSRIFESGFTTKGDRGGTGLGLAMVKRTLDEMGGEVKVRSELDRGTAFELLLPLLRCGQAVPAGDGAASEAPRRGAGETVLIVDDEETVLTMLCDLLQHLGYNYLSCSGAAEALRVFKARHRDIELVVVDHTMPSMSGRELAEKIKRLVPAMPVVLTSGYPPESIGRGPEDDFLAKPFDLDRVARVVARHVQWKGRR